MIRASKKGQALVEFVIILPVLILLFFGAVDFGRIIIRKNELENLSSDIVSMYKEGKATSEMEELLKENNKDNTLKITSSDKYTEFDINSSIKIITPGLNKILGNDYIVKVKRVIYNE